MTHAKPRFVTATQEQDQTVQKIAPLQAYLVQYKDGSGKQQVRVVFQVPNTEAIFILANSVSNVSLLKTATKWFTNAFLKRLKKKETPKLEDIDNSGEEGLSQL